MNIKGLKQHRCIACGAVSVMTDAIGMFWCEDHTFRGDFVNWGAAHAWCGVHCGPYAVAKGLDMYKIAAALGDEAMIWALRSSQEMPADARNSEVA